ncbi:hypothetical protein QTO34_013810 [Cnephaeus nilssonii]|uniref:Aminopeptidase n=1 Tax=Cnephaeus nilssonii TaxID=3371016 RepID=A0AA40LV92_CNENI|nr:hypothetical protein QTO34_013810 [Eptesicus nilssonii]
MGKRNNSQRKENVESPRKEISENEACNMTEKEFRVMVMEFIHRMDEKINNLCKNQEEMKSDIATIKNTMESFNSRLQEAEDRISELEDQVQKQAQAEQQLEKKIKKQEESLRELRDNMKRSNMRIIGLPEGQEEQQGLENLFEEIMTENFPDMGKIKVTQTTGCIEDFPGLKSRLIRRKIRASKVHSSEQCWRGWGHGVWPWPSGADGLRKNMKHKYGSIRLPNTVIPLHYDLFVHPNLTSLDFVASEKIEILVRDATQFIILHSKDLEIMNVTLHSEEDLRYRKPGRKLDVLSYPAHEQIVLLVPEKLTADLKYYVAIDFQGKLADGFEGFYKSTYRTLGGETRTIAVTDFEPTEARMAFPCFDEPLFKANFSIKIRRESRHIALSNTPKVKTVELEGGLLEDHFETTVKMSTYLVAYIVCDFKFVSGTTSSGVKWFGNLVTMEWWNDIWLNEGFAKYMELISVNATYPELQFDDYFLEVCFEVIKRDSLNSSHPISNQAKTPTQIQEMFDTISYNKGACILNMLKDFLSEEKFRKGIIHYLKKFSYRNAKNDDLWRSMSNLTFQGEDVEVKEMMATWTLQKGIPLVVVEREGRSLRLRQERFLSGVFKEDPAWRALQERYLWHIPLTYSTSSSNVIHRHILKSKTDILDLPENTNWVKFNVNSNGYYIVHYEGHGWDQLIQQLNQNHTLLRPKDRTGLIHDAFQLVSAGRLTLDKALDLTRYLPHETSRLALLKGLGYLELFYHMMDRRNISDVTENLKHYLLRYFKPVIDTQSWSDEGSTWDRMLRSTLLKLACDLNHAPCIRKATDLFSQWMESSGKLNIPTDVLKIVYSVGAQTTAGWNYLLEQYELSMSGAEKNKILYALSTSKHQEKLMKLIDLGMEGKIIKTQDLASLLHAIARSPKGQQLAWNFVRDNWTHLLKKFGLGSFDVRIIISGTTSHFSSKDELQEV